MDKADAFFKRTASDLQQRSITLSGLPTIQCSSIEEVGWQSHHISLGSRPLLPQA